MLLIECHRDFVVQSDNPNRKLMDAIKFYSDIHTLSLSLFETRWHFTRWHRANNIISENRTFPETFQKTF